MARIKESEAAPNTRQFKPFGIQKAYALDYQVKESSNSKVQLTVLFTDGTEVSKEKTLPSGEKTTKLFFYTDMTIYRDPNESNKETLTMLEWMMDRLELTKRVDEEIYGDTEKSYIDKLKAFGQMLVDVGEILIGFKAVLNDSGYLNPKLSTIPVTVKDEEGNKLKVGRPQVCLPKKVLKNTIQTERWEDNNGYKSEVITYAQFRLGGETKEVTASKKYDIPDFDNEGSYDDDAFGGSSNDEESAEGVF